MDFGKPQTIFMSHIYMKFDFGADEEKAQAACHKLDGWRQAFRLDKKVQYTVDREESSAPEATEKAAKPAKAGASEKSKSKDKGKELEKEAPRTAQAPNGKVSLVVRFYFSNHEKLSEQRWIGRIPKEEPFKSASPQIIRKEDAAFEKVDQEFESRERAEHRNATVRS